MSILSHAPAPNHTDCAYRWCVGNCDSAPGLESHYTQTATVADAEVYALVQVSGEYGETQRIDREVYVGQHAFSPGQARELAALLLTLADIAGGAL